MWAASWQNQQNDCASALSDQSIRCARNGQLRTRCFFMRTAKTVIRLGGCTCHFVGFVMQRFRCAFSTTLKYKCMSHLTSLSHLSAHIVNRLLRENRKSIPKFLSGKQLLKNVTFQILNFIPVSLIKVLPIWCNFKFLCFFVLFNALKTDIKLKLHHMRNFLLCNLPR